jgi:plasmid stabilization system protein ParE
LTWPPERQADVARVVELMEEQDKSELLEWPYIIVYTINEERDEIVIVSVMHGARDRQGRGD